MRLYRPVPESGTGKDAACSASPAGPDSTNATLATSPVRALMTLLPAAAVRLRAAGTGRRRTAAAIP